MQAAAGRWVLCCSNAESNSSRRQREKQYSFYASAKKKHSEKMYITQNWFSGVAKRSITLDRDTIIYIRRERSSSSSRRALHSKLESQNIIMDSAAQHTFCNKLTFCNKQ